MRPLPPFTWKKAAELRDSKNYDELVTGLRANVEFLRSTYGPAFGVVNIWVDALFQAFVEVGDSAAAEDALVRHMAESTHEDVKQDVHMLLQLAYLHLPQRRDAQAEAVLKDAAAKLAGIPGGWLPAEIALCVHRAKLCLHRDEFDAGEKFLLRALELCAQHHGPGDPRYGMVLDHLCELHQARGQIDAAECEIRQALAIYEAASHTESADYAMALSRLGLIQARQGNEEAAAMSQGQALEIITRVRPQSSPAVGIVKKRHAAAHSAATAP